MTDLQGDQQLLPVEAAFEAFCKAWVAGEQPDPERFCEVYPDIKRRLREKIDAFLYTAQALNGLRNNGAAKDLPTGLKPGDRVGDHQILKKIGLGGMGVVYEALQISLGRSVALKVLSPHCALRSKTVERFKREAATSSKLDHPGIVRIYGFGEDRGLLYYTMDLVEGAPLDKVISSLKMQSPNRLDGVNLAAAVAENSIRHYSKGPSHRNVYQDTQSPYRGQTPAWKEPPFWRQTFTEAACRLILQIADALEHAHSKGVIHRDVKPSNILIQENGSAVLTDFGIARTQGLPTITVTGEFAGTPCYVSPEQVAGKGAPVDRRTDVYSLGVTLFEILTLERPFDGSSSREVLDKIVSKDPPHPRRLNPEISRDLETICLTAIEKNPDRRYPTAADLASDLRCFLEYRPIAARPLGPVTRAIRLLRRKPAQSLAVGLLLLVIIGGPLGYGIQKTIANRAILAALAEKENAIVEIETQKARADAETSTALREAEKVRLATNLLENLFLEPFKKTSKNGSDLFALFFRRAADSIRKDLTDAPLIQAELLHTVGVAHINLGLLTEAESLLKEALNIRQEKLGLQNTDTIHSQLELARLYHHQDRFREEESLLRSALKSIQDLPEDNRIKYILALNGLGTMCLETGRLSEARIHLESGLKEAKKIWNGDHRILLELRNKLGRLCMREGRFDQAEKLLKASLEERERSLGPEHPETVSSMQSLAELYLHKSDFKKAKSLFSKSCEILSRTLSPDDNRLLKAKANLGFVLFKIGKLEEAEGLFREVLHREKTDSNASKIDVSLTMSQLGIVLKGLGKTEEAVKYLSAAFECLCNLAESRIYINLDLLKNCLNALSEINRSQGRFFNAAVLYEKALHVPGLSTSTRLALMNNAAFCFYHSGDIEKAKIFIKECLDKTSPDDPEFPYREQLRDKILEKK